MTFTLTGDIRQHAVKARRVNSLLIFLQVMQAESGSSRLRATPDRSGFSESHHWPGFPQRFANSFSANSMKYGQFGAGVCPYWCWRNATSPVSTKDPTGGMVAMPSPLAPSRFQTGLAAAAAMNMPFVSCHASPGAPRVSPAQVWTVLRAATEPYHPKFSPHKRFFVPGTIAKTAETGKSGHRERRRIVEARSAAPERREGSLFLEPVRVFFDHGIGQNLAGNSLDLSARGVSI